MFRLLVKRRHLSQRKRRRLFLYWIIALIMVTAVFANGAKFFGEFSSGLGKPPGAELTFKKFQGEKITGVVNSEPLILATFDPQEKRVNFWELPPDLYLEVADKGYFLASKIYNLDQTPDGGIKLLVDTLMANFAIPIDFYIEPVKTGVTQDTIREIFNKIREPSSLFLFFQIPKSSQFVKTNFTPIDQFKLFWQLKNIRKDKFDYQIMPLNNFEELILPNGDKVKKISTDGLTPALTKIFQDLKIAKEGLTIGVYNASGKTGLANLITKICQNLGATAFVAGADEQILPTTKILVRQNLVNSFTAKRLFKTFGGKLEKGSSQELADIIIFAGSDLARRLTGTKI